MKTNTVSAALCLALAVTLAGARPSPEAEVAGYSYKPPNPGVRLNYQTWSAAPAESRTRASEVTVEQVPIRLVQESTEVRHQPSAAQHFPPAGSYSPSGRQQQTLNRGAYHFPNPVSSQDVSQQYVRGTYQAPGAVVSNLNVGARQEQSQQLNKGYQSSVNAQPLNRGAYQFPPSSNAGQEQYYRAGYQVQPSSGGNFNAGLRNEQQQQQLSRGAYQFPSNNNGGQEASQQYLRGASGNFNAGIRQDPQQFSRGAYQFPQTGGISQQAPQQRGAYVFPNHNSISQNAENSQRDGSFGRQQQFNNNGYGQQQSPPLNNNQQPLSNEASNSQNQFSNTPSAASAPDATASPGYQYNTPNVDVPQQTAPPTTEAATTPLMVISSTISPAEAPRISIAISKSTVIHTGSGTYRLDEKSGSNRPLVAEAHSIAELPAREEKKPELSKDDSLSGEGTGNFPIINKGTPDKDSLVEGAETEAPEESSPTTTTTPAPAPAAPLPQLPLYSTGWPMQHYGQHAHVVIAPGQTQYFSLGSSSPNTRSPYIYQPLQTTTPHIYQHYASQYSPQYAPHTSYHPSVLQGRYITQPRATTGRWPFATYFPIIIRDPFVSMYGALSSVLEYGPEADVCKGKEGVDGRVDEPNNEGTNEAEESKDNSVATAEDNPDLQGVHPGSTSTIIEKGGVAIAGPGGYADAGRGGTAIVGPGGTAYSSPHSVSVVGPGGRVVEQGLGRSEKILAQGPIIYYHKP